MDRDYWASRIYSAKHLSAVHSVHLSSGTHVMLDDSQVNADNRTYFTCPFCYVDTELSLLCSHLQEEHCFDVKNAVCPVCALNLGKDFVGHFKVHHANSIRSRRKPQRSSFCSSNSVRELGSFYGFSARSSAGNVHDSALDPLLSLFLCIVPYPEPKTDSLQDACSRIDASIAVETESSKLSTSNKIQEEDSEARRHRAEFFQRLIMSTIF
ncbi:hypothetical protein Ancab_035802 [Ancistrocladus abbreviatus]